MDDDWFNAGNWTLGVPEANFASNRRANLQSATDLENWPVIKSGQTVNINQRLQMPLEPLVAEPITYGRLTIESGGTLNAGNDFRAGEDGDEFGFQTIVGSLNVAGMLTLGNRSRFANADYTTMDVDVTGTMIHTNQEQAFRIGGGESSSADFDISGSGLVSVTAPFELFEASLLSISDDGKLTLFEYEYEVEDEFGVVIGTAIFTRSEIIDQVAEYATAGWFEGLTDAYTGLEMLTGIGNGLAYYEDANSVSFVAAPIAPPVVDGDFNFDGVYDAADYVIWRKNEGTETEYAAWVTSFGTSQELGGGGGQSVPEISTLGLFACGIIWLPLGRARKNKRAGN